MASFILLSCLFIFVVALFANNQSAVKPNKNLLLGVTLPYDSLNDNAVTEITNQYKKAYTRLLAVFALFALPILLFTKYVSLSMIYMFTWIILLIVLNDKVLKSHAGRLLELKKKNGWFLANKNIVSIDTEVLKVKEKMPVSPLWFIPAVITAFLPLVLFLAGHPSAGDLLQSLLPVPNLLVFFLLYRLTSSQRTTVYSDKTDINMACNLIYKRCWSVFAVIGALAGSIGMTAFSLMNWSRFSHPVPIIAFPTLFAITFIVAIVYTKKYILKKQGRILEAAENIIYTDDDYYWRNGFYNNPNDRRMLVEKRIGYGFTVNMATIGGKLFVYGILGTVGLMVIFLLVKFLNMDFNGFQLSVQDQTVVIDAPLYDYSFRINDITDLKQVDTIPSGSRTNGAETGKYCIGHFNLQGYGASRLYLYKNNPPYIVVKLKETYVFINGKTPDETQVFYDLLR